jgi:UDPglucose 6-dehydrogenase
MLLSGQKIDRTGDNMNIGIIGQGFVGSAIREGLKNFYEIKAFDIDSSKCWNITNPDSVDEVVSFCDIIFVCVPTPMRKDGSCDTRVLESALNTAYASLKKQNPDPIHSDFLKTMSYKKTFVIKSTILPGTTEKLSAKYPRINLCFSPEFLTEANSFSDFKNQNRIIIGGDGAKSVKSMFRKPFPNASIIVTKSETAEMVKYSTNCFLATKVTFANQMYQICLDNNIDYDKVCEYMLYDNRIGKSHLAVPGPDGDLGFGGHCFPKDLAAMINFGSSCNGNTGFLEAVQDFNNSVRKIRDWEHMKGRAVSDD